MRAWARFNPLIGILLIGTESLCGLAEWLVRFNPLIGIPLIGTAQASYTFVQDVSFQSPHRDSVDWNDEPEQWEE